MRYILTFYCLLYSAVLFAQVDTIHTGREKIACTVKEVTPEAVLYFYSGETVTNSLYKNTIQKIVFRSGRIQTFSESYILAKIEDIADFGKVTITQVEGEIKGLLKVGQVSAFSRGGSIFSNVDRVKERALNKLKMEAVMRGANLIYITYEKTEGNQYGGYFQAPEAAKTIYSGVVYSNVVPDKSGFLSRISSVDLLASNRQITLSKGGAITKAAYCVEETPTDIRITRSYEEGGQLFVDATIRGFETNNFRVVRYDATTFTLLAENKNKVVNFIVPFKE